MKNLFDQYMLEVANKFGKHLSDNTEGIMEGMDKVLKAAFSPKKIKGSSFRDLVEGYSKLYNNFADILPKEQMTGRGDEEAKTQLMTLMENAFLAKPMERREAEAIYYQENPEQNVGENNETT